MKFAITFVVEAHSEKALRKFIEDTLEINTEGIASILVVGVAQAIEVVNDETEH
jgi:hypothetical protein